MCSHWTRTTRGRPDHVCGEADSGPDICQHSINAILEAGAKLAALANNNNSLMLICS